MHAVAAVDVAGASAPVARRCCHGGECVNASPDGGALLSRYNSGPDCHACAAAGKLVRRPSLAGPGPELIGEVYMECEGCGRLRLIPETACIRSFDALDKYAARYPRCQSCTMERRHAAEGVSE